jgi:hypothetical protein
MLETTVAVHSTANAVKRKGAQAEPDEFVDMESDASLLARIGINGGPRDLPTLIGAVQSTDAFLAASNAASIPD